MYLSIYLSIDVCDALCCLYMYALLWWSCAAVYDNLFEKRGQHLAIYVLVYLFWQFIYVHCYIHPLCCLYMLCSCAAMNDNDNLLDSAVWYTYYYTYFDLNLLHNSLLVSHWVEFTPYLIDFWATKSYVADIMFTGFTFLNSISAFAAASLAGFDMHIFFFIQYDQHHQVNRKQSQMNVASKGWHRKKHWGEDKHLMSLNDVCSSRMVHN